MKIARWLARPEKVAATDALKHRYSSKLELLMSEIEENPSAAIVEDFFLELPGIIDRVVEIADVLQRPFALLLIGELVAVKQSFDLGPLFVEKGDRGG